MAKNGNVKGAANGRMVDMESRGRIPYVERSKMEEKSVETNFRSYAEFLKDDGVTRGKSFQDCSLTLIQRFDSSDKELVSGAVLFEVKSGPKIRADVLCHHFINAPDAVLESAWNGSRNLKNYHIEAGKKLKVSCEPVDEFGSFKAILKEVIKTPFKSEEKVVGWIYISSNGSINNFNVGLQCLNPLMMAIQERMAKQFKSKTDFDSIAYSSVDDVDDTTDDEDYLKVD